MLAHDMCRCGDGDCTMHEQCARWVYRRAIGRNTPQATTLCRNELGKGPAYTTFPHFYPMKHEKVTRPKNT
jgi:hypothetical protein